ncbi:hypothetical protein M413DRAFT_412424 [Hebeloma cylindrosporum]|uniref:HNH nuclease domain-containing protein n=1 Tax=Hebeloma cylindrosporum TaxID=76867 RepID=A0A0C3CA64_HEBCY|nr:hypothetical protein M413DRAFT_412424 [Hebeloma cylindrosporum h7]
MQTSTSQVGPPVWLFENCLALRQLQADPPKRVFCFLHPTNDPPFLKLPAYDCCPPKGGIHYGTALVACEILTCNKSGYLSSSRNRDGDGRVNVDLDSVIPAGKYYYHLDMEPSDPLYPICQVFSCWKFPHNKLPSAWEHKHPKSAPQVWPSDWEEISQVLENRDAACLVSEWTESLTVAHIVHHTEEKWLQRNRMDAQFDRGGIIIVPESDQLVVHFLRRAGKAASLYHNVPFSHKDSLSFELLYAHFAWGLMNIVKKAELDPDEFNLVRASGETNKQQGGIGATDDGCVLEGSHVMVDTNANTGTKRKMGIMVISVEILDLEAQELEEDMKEAARILPFFVIEASPSHYENIVWYPGKAAVEGRKQAYLRRLGPTATERYPTIIICLMTRIRPWICSCSERFIFWPFPSWPLGRDKTMNLSRSTCSLRPILDNRRPNELLAPVTGKVIIGMANVHHLLSTENRRPVAYCEYEKGAVFGIRYRNNPPSNFWLAGVPVPQVQHLYEPHSPRHLQAIGSPSSMLEQKECHI